LKGEKEMKKKGFTLVELLVVIAIIALLMSILMPTLSKVRMMAQRAVCSTNLGSLYKSFATYAQENDQDYPRAGGRRSIWTISTNPVLPLFYANTEQLAFRGGTNPNTTGRATIGASLYLLIKYADAEPKEFLCGGDRGAVEFKLSLYPKIPANSQLAKTQDITKGWDFGGPAGDRKAGGIPPGKHYSYSYHMPYGGVEQQFYTMSATRPSDLPVMADRNPYLVLIKEVNRTLYSYDATRHDPAREMWGNSPNHKYEGQNVLYNDSSVKWRPVSYCGRNQDNIYTIQTNTNSPQIGEAPRLFDSGGSLPQTDNDSLLVNEGYDQLGVQ
jgi:prepilin-type N-terminal cleavage/methylation domain-containing protein